MPALKLLLMFLLCIERSSAADDVGFYAKLSDTIVTKSEGEHIKFTQTIMNEGGAYDNSTGTFTAPGAGIYVFKITMHTSDSPKDTACRLVKGDETLGALKRLKDLTILSVHAEVRLKQEDKVWVECAPRTSVVKGTLFTGNLVRHVRKE